MIAVIPRTQIKKVSLYINSGKKTMEAIKRELGCQYILNAGLFDMKTFQPASYLVKDRKVLCAKCNPYGYALNGDAVTYSYANNVNAPDFIGAYPVLVSGGKATGDPAPAGLGGYRQRTCVGIQKDGTLVLLCDQTNRSLEGVAGDLIYLGCNTAINLDGGGSTQGDFNGKTLNSERLVHSFLCVWTKGEEADKPENMSTTDKKKRVLLIAGHGAGDHGAIAFSWKEAELTRALVPLIRDALAGYMDVDIYDMSRNAYYDYKAGTLKDRAKFQSYDYVMEVHFNACKPDRGDGKNKGTEIYVTTAEKSVGVEQAILQNMEALGFTNRGVKRHNFAVIQTAKSSGTSSALLEVCFIDDMDDMMIFYRDGISSANKTAHAIARGILTGFGIKTPKPFVEDSMSAIRQRVQEKAGLSDATMTWLDHYIYSEDLYRKLAKAMQ